MVDISVCIFTPENHCYNDVTECLCKVTKGILQISINGNPYVDIINDNVVMFTRNWHPGLTFLKVYSAYIAYEYRDSVKNPINKKRGSAKKVCKVINKWLAN